jgi:O-acetyl-ADP-ribose deacetylase (regulator of RNase III)
MPLRIIRDDITRVKADAIVNAANSRLLAGGGVCGAIFAAAGETELSQACQAIGHCPTGQAVITPGFQLPAKFIIHAVGPVWLGGRHGERELLASCYRASLELALAHRLRSIAFPLISTGIYGYRKRRRCRSRSASSAFLLEHDMTVTWLSTTGHLSPSRKSCSVRSPPNRRPLPG